MKFNPQNDYLFVKAQSMPMRGILERPMAETDLTLGVVLAGPPEFEGKSVLFDARGLVGVWIGNDKHAFIRKNEIISIVEFAIGTFSTEKNDKGFTKVNIDL